ncbi:MAG: biotin/lipoyl-containing protein [Lachnospiraceae bacterium]|nr:biotin/lipoyl-containing protein [Lachnospiraceae bacterium]
MKNYRITVNGTAYDVMVEEMDGNTSSASAAVSGAAVKPAVKPAVKSAARSETGSGAAGNIQVKAGAAGKVVKIEAGVGVSVNKGDTVVIIEAMKMEIPVVAPENGTVASIECKIGDAIDSGAVLATLN